MSVDTAMERLRTANPAPDTRLLRDESEDLTALLTATWHRSTNMQTQQPQKVEPTKERKTRGWLVALATAAVVLVIAGVISLLSTSDGAEPATEVPITTTTVAALVETVTTTVEPVTTVAPAPVPPNMVQIEAFDYGYSGFDVEIVVGDALELFNTSETEYHNLVVLFLEDDDTRTLDDFASLPIEEMDAEDRRFVINMAGGIQAAPGEMADRRIRLQRPGRYIAFDDVPQGLDAEIVRANVDPEDPAIIPDPPWFLDGGPLGYQHGMIIEFFVIEK
jgi:hypothetical protein